MPAEGAGKKLDTLNKRERLKRELLSIEGGPIVDLERAVKERVEIRAEAKANLDRLLVGAEAARQEQHCKDSMASDVQEALGTLRKRVNEVRKATSMVAYHLYDSRLAE